MSILNIIFNTHAHACAHPQTHTHIEKVTH